MKKRILTFILLFAMFFVYGKEVTATENLNHQVRLDYVNSHSIVLTLDKSQCNANFKAKNGTINISATVTVYKLTGKKYVKQKSWNATTKGNRLNMNNKIALSGGKYKVVAKVTSTCNGKTETVTKTSYFNI